MPQQRCGRTRALPVYAGDQTALTAFTVGIQCSPYPVDGDALSWTNELDPSVGSEDNITAQAEKLAVSRLQREPVGQDILHPAHDCVVQRRAPSFQLEP